jgi:hypothetical protein
MNPEIIQQTFTDEIYAIRSRVLILIPVEWSVLTPSEIDLLGKILGAVQLNLDGVQVITENVADLNNFTVFAPTAVLSFGVRIKQADNPYEVTIWNTISVLYSDALHQLDEDRKKKLWEAMRKMFKSA